MGAIRVNGDDTHEGKETNYQEMTESTGTPGRSSKSSESFQYKARECGILLVGINSMENGWIRPLQTTQYQIQDNGAENISQFFTL